MSSCSKALALRLRFSTGDRECQRFGVLEYTNAESLWQLGQDDDFKKTHLSTFDSRDWQESSSESHFADTSLTPLCLSGSCRIFTQQYNTAAPPDRLGSLITRTAMCWVKTLFQLSLTQDSRPFISKLWYTRVPWSHPPPPCETKPSIASPSSHSSLHRQLFSRWVGRREFHRAAPCAAEKHRCGTPQIPLKFHWSLRLARLICVSCLGKFNFGCK